MDINKDGEITIDDFKQLFSSYDQYGGAQMDEDLWKHLLMEADRSGDGKVTFEEFRAVMREMVRKSWLRVADRSPDKSRVAGGSPYKSCYGGYDSPAKKYIGTDGSPLKRHGLNPEETGENLSPLKKGNCQIISPERGNPFRGMDEESPGKKSQRRSG